MTIEIRRLDLESVVPADFAAVVAMARADATIRDPGDPPMPEREIKNDLIDPHPRLQKFVWLAERDGVVVGTARAGTESAPDDELQLAVFDVYVDPDHRRTGVATALARQAVPDLIEAGQNSLAAFPCLDLGSEAALAYCERLGLPKRTEERCSRALVADIDDELLDTWMADAVTAAPGYRLEQWEGICPDDVATAWCEAEAAMDDAPLDEFEYHRVDLDAAAQRRDDEAAIAGGFLVYRSLVLAPDGAAAGLSALYVHHDRPQVGYQDDTAVLPAHRGRRLGRWLKAANFRLAQKAHPELTVLETYNAQSNPWMLDINVAMGFRPHHYYDGCQAPLREVAARLV